MTRTILITTQKGGVGKTTITATIGAGLARKGYKTLIVELEPQLNLTYMADVKAKEGKTSLEVILGKVPAKEAIVRSEYCDIIPASKSLVVANTELQKMRSRNTKLKEALESIKSLYDFILIDTVPALDLLKINAVLASDYIIVPATTGTFDIQGLMNFRNYIEGVNAVAKTEHKINAICINMYDKRSNIHRHLAQQIEEKVGEAVGAKVYKSKIRRLTAVEEATYYKEPLFTYEPKGKAVADFTALVEELLEDIKE